MAYKDLFLFTGAIVFRGAKKGGLYKKALKKILIKNSVFNFDIVLAINTF
jgi:hypothetical protein